MKIKSVRCYQAVSFDKAPQTHFTVEKVPNKKAVQIKLIDNVFVEVKSETDLVHIPLTNISGIYFFNAHDEVKAKFNKEEESKKKDVKRDTIKRPK